jgi:hypothetical protein
MIKYPLFLALFFFCQTTVSAQQQPKDSVDILAADLRHATSIVESLRKSADSQYHNMESLKKKPATPAQKSELKKAQARFDSTLVQLDTSVGTMNELTERLTKIYNTRSKH